MGGRHGWSPMSFQPPDIILTVKHASSVNSPSHPLSFSYIWGNWGPGSCVLLWVTWLVRGRAGILYPCVRWSALLLLQPGPSQRRVMALPPQKWAEGQEHILGAHSPYPLLSKATWRSRERQRWAVMAQTFQLSHWVLLHPPHSWISPGAPTNILHRQNSSSCVQQKLKGHLSEHLLWLIADSSSTHSHPCWRGSCLSSQLPDCFDMDRTFSDSGIRCVSTLCQKLGTRETVVIVLDKTL